MPYFTNDNPILRNQSYMRSILAFFVMFALTFMFSAYPPASASSEEQKIERYVIHSASKHSKIINVTIDNELFPLSNYQMQMQMDYYSNLYDLKQLIDSKLTTRNEELKNLIENMTEQDWWALYHVVHAEGEPLVPYSYVGITAVVLNRVMSPLFPNTVYDVVYQKYNDRYQFDVVTNGTINKPVTDVVIEAVHRALEGEDPTCGSLYFRVPKVYGQSNSYQTPSIRIGKTEFFFSTKDEQLREKQQYLKDLHEFGLTKY